MSRFYAVCNVNGPISVRLQGETEAEALASFEALDTRAAIDGCKTDAENAAGIDGSDMSEEGFGEALEAAGFERVRDLSPIVNAHAGAATHLADGWMLWRDDTDLVVVEYMPEQFRASHEAAGNRGFYPHNGAVRYAMTRDEADDHLDEDGWCFVVDGADPSQYERAAEFAA